MMTLIPFFFTFIFIFIKDFYFLSSVFSLDLSTLFMVCIFPMILFLFESSLFNFINNSESLIFNSLNKLVILFLFFCFSSCESFIFLVFLENCVILMVLYILLYSKDYDKITSTFFMFFINICPSILFMYFCASFPYSSFCVVYLLKESSSSFVFMCFLGLLVSKLPLFLFHFWLTKAHVSASGCGSMILASLMLKIGSMGLFKFFHFFSSISKIVSNFNFVFVSWSMLILLSIMSRFFDLKYLVACSSIVHMGPIFCLCLFGSSESIFSVMMMMVGHGLISYLIFFIVTLMYELNHHRSIDFNKSLASFSKLGYLFFLLLFLLNMGFPPFVSFLSELLFLHSFFIFDYFIFFLFCFSLILSGLVFFLVVSKTLFGKKNISEGYKIFMSNYLFSWIFFFVYISIPFFFF